MNLTSMRNKVKYGVFDGKNYEKCRLRNHFS